MLCHHISDLGKRRNILKKKKKDNEGFPVRLEPDRKTNHFQLILF